MAHRHSSFQLLLLVALVLLVAQYPAEAQADYSALATELEPELEHNISIADFGIARRINHLADFGHAVTRSVTPTVLFSFDAKEQGESVDVWSFFIRNIAHATEKWGIPVLYTTINTEVGVALPYSYRLPSKQSILMFNNDMTAVNGSLTLWKVPTYFSGSLDLVKVLQWILESISHSAIERINNEHELIDYFDKYNDLTMLPHVLFFTLRNYTSPVYKIVSQRLSMNAAFGVVVDALSTPEKRDIAARYNLTKPEDFPAVLALHKLGGDTDDVHRMPNVTSDTTHEELTEFLADELDVEFSFEFYEPWNSRSKLQQFQMYMTQENDRLQALLMEESMQEGGQRITNVTTEEEWREGCLKSDRGHCLVIFANKKKQAEVTEILRDSAKRMRELAPENTTRQQIDFAILEPSRSKAIMKFFRSTKSDLVLIETAPTFRFLRYEGSLSSSTVAHLLFTRTEESAHGWVEATLDEVPELGTAAPRERRSRRGAAAREEPASPGDGELDL